MTIEDALSRLSAGLDRDEAAANHALYLQSVGVTPDTPPIVHRYEWAWHTRMPSTGGGGTQYVPGVPDPARALRQVEAIRKVIAALNEADHGSGPEPDPWALCAEIAEALASIYTEDTDETGADDGKG